MTRFVPKILSSNTANEVLRELGSRLRTYRLQQNLRVAEVATRAGLNRNTIVNAEAGKNPPLGTIGALLGVYGRLEACDAFLPAPTISPLPLVRSTGHVQQRARTRPALRVERAAERGSVEIAALVEQARAVVAARPDIAIPAIMRVGASAGGARPKAVILWNRTTNEIRSGFAKPRRGEEQWMIKFDGVGELDAPDPTPKPFNRVEYAYSRLARDAGIQMPETELLEERRCAHLMVKRFDRVGNRRLHLHSLAGLHHVDYNIPGQFSYEQFLRTILELKLGYPALEEGFRRAVFNIVAVNQDDHVKNISFLMDQHGVWRLAPAYDVTYARGAGFTRTHQMTLNNKSDGFTSDDLLSLGLSMRIKRNGVDIVDRIVRVMGKWDAYARAANVPADEIARIQSQFRLI